MTTISVSSAGVVSLVPAVGDLVALDFTTVDYLGDGVVVDVSIFLKAGSTTPTPENTVLKLLIRDSVTDDNIFSVQGVIGLDVEDTASLLNIAEASEYFSNFELDFTAVGFATIASSDAYNAPNSLGRDKVTLTLPDSQPPAFDADDVYDAITLMEPKPSYIVLPCTDDLAVVVAAQRAMNKLNIPLRGEIDPSLTVDQAIAAAEGIDAQDHRFSLVWNPNLSRPRDAVSIRGAKIPRGAIGAIIGMLLLRNARANAQGIPALQTAVAGFDYPITFKAMTPRPDVTLNDGALEKLAIAKVNVVRRVVYEDGARFVVSDVLTQYDSKTSVLRLEPASEITCYTANRCIEILRRHMLKNTATFLADADRDINRFLTACSSGDSKLLVPAEDLGGKPFVFRLTPDEQLPHERVRFYFARRPEGTVRSVVFDDVVTK